MQTSWLETKSYGSNLKKLKKGCYRMKVDSKAFAFPIMTVFRSTNVKQILSEQDSKYIWQLFIFIFNLFLISNPFA